MIHVSLKRIFPAALVFSALCGCTSQTRHERGLATQNQSEAQDADDLFRQQKDAYYREAIPPQFRTRIDLTPSQVELLRTADCGDITPWIGTKESPERTTFFLKKINRPFWYASMSEPGGRDYMLGTPQQMQDLICILRMIDPDPLSARKSAMDPVLQRLILDQPKINWSVFNVLVHKWGERRPDVALIQKLISHPNIDLYSADEAIRVPFRGEFSVSDRIKIMEVFYRSAVYQKNTAFFDARMKSHLQAMSLPGMRPLLEYLAVHKAHVFDREKLMWQVTEADPGGDLTSMYEKLAAGQSFPVRSRLLTSVLRSDAKLANSDQKIRSMWLEFKTQPSESEFFYHLLGYEKLRGQLSKQALYEIYWEMLDLLPESESVKMAETLLMVDKTALEFDSRLKLFEKACLLSVSSRKLADYYFPVAMKLNHEQPAAFRRILPCLSSFAGEFPKDPVVIDHYESFVYGLTDESVKIRLALELVKKDMASDGFKSNIVKNAFEARTEDAYALLAAILRNPNLSHLDLNEISLNLHRQAGKTNDSEKALLKLIESHPQATDEMKARSRQTRSGKWETLSLDALEKLHP